MISAGCKTSEERVYPCFSGSYNAFNRINLALCSPDLFSEIKDLCYLPRVISDHSPILITLKDGSFRTRFSNWKLNPTWLNSGLDLVFIKSRIEQFYEYNRGSASSVLVWDPMTAYVQGILNVEIFKIRNGYKRKKEEIKQLLRKANLLRTPRI